MANTTIKKSRLIPLREEKWGRNTSSRKRVRLWIDEPGGKFKAATSRDYETVGT
jgi:hypothetical protein